MADEPRRSGRATKGQHNKNASASPPPATKPTKNTKAKPRKKSVEVEPEDDEEEQIRCVCGNDNSKDKRAFIGCDACGVWQHNICMGVTDDADEIPDHYFCEQCDPSYHQETLQSIEEGTHIWDTRNKIYQAEKKLSKSRKGKGKTGEDARPGWLKKDLPEEPTEQEQEQSPAQTTPQSPASTNKRKRDDVKDEVKEDEADQMPRRVSRQDKRRKPSIPDSKEDVDAEHALVEIDQLPNERQKVALTLSKIIADDVTERVQAGYSIPDSFTLKSLADHHATRIEYALHMNHGGQALYGQQFRALNANMKKNRMLITRLLDESLTADELAKMESKDMASEELQKERAAVKAELDRQALVLEDDGPKYRYTHKGPELIDTNAHRASNVVSNARPVRERDPDDEDADESARRSVSGIADSPIATEATPVTVEPNNPLKPSHDRRASSQQFDMNDVWAKTAQSPTTSSVPPGTRPMQLPPRRRSSIRPKPEQAGGAKHDADIDRMLEDNDDAYAPTDFSGDNTVVWRGKLVQSAGDGEPTVNARFVAGRDLSLTIAWRDLLPSRLDIDGRLVIDKAEEYLCGLEWSHTSDVSVLALTPYDDADAFNRVFDYFHSRSRYAVVGKGLPALVKDLYIIPVEVGTPLPEHVNKLEHCRIKLPVERRILLATYVVARAPDGQATTPLESTPVQQNASNGHHLPPYVRPSATGPAGSPITSQTPVFSPPPQPGNGVTPFNGYGAPGPFAPNPYASHPGGHPEQTPPPPQPNVAGPFPPSIVQHYNPLVDQILGPLQMAPTAQQILAADPQIPGEKLVNLKRILEDDPETRTNIEALAKRLGMLTA